MLTSISTAVMAHDEQSCNVNFDKDLSISSQLVSMSDAGTELWRRAAGYGIEGFALDATGDVAATTRAAAAIATKLVSQLFLAAADQIVNSGLSRPKIPSRSALPPAA